MHVDQFKQAFRGDAARTKRLVTLPHGGSGNCPVIVLECGKVVYFVSDHFCEVNGNIFRYVSHHSSLQHFAVNPEDLV